MACWMRWAKAFHPQLRSQWKPAAPRNAAPTRPARSHSWPASSVGSHAPGTKGSSNARSSAKIESRASASNTGGRRSSRRATTLATSPTTKTRQFGRPYSRKSRFIGLSARSRWSSNGSSSAGASTSIGLPSGMRGEKSSRTGDSRRDDGRRIESTAFCVFPGRANVSRLRYHLHEKSTRLTSYIRLSTCDYGVRCGDSLPETEHPEHATVQPASAGSAASRTADELASG